MSVIEPYPLSTAERLVLQQRVRRSVALLAALSEWYAEIQQPCGICGCLLFAPVPGGYRCLHCWPPLELPELLRRQIKKTFSDSD